MPINQVHLSQVRVYTSLTNIFVILTILGFLFVLTGIAARAARLAPFLLLAAVFRRGTLLILLVFLLRHYHLLVDASHHSLGRLLLSTFVRSEDLCIPLACFLILLTIEHSLEQIFSVLILPPILLVLIAECVREGQRVLQHSILALFQSNLVLDQEFDQFELVVEALELRLVRVGKVVGLKVEARSAGHDIYDDLHQSLLLERVDNVLIALHVGHSQLDLFEVERGLALK